MPLPYWYEKGRAFAVDVEDGLGAGAFRPADAMTMWFDFTRGSDLPPFEGLTDEQADELSDLIYTCLSVPAFRRQFAEGYRAGLRGTRPARRAREHAA